MSSWIGHTSGMLVVCVPPTSHSLNLEVELVTLLRYKCYASNAGIGGPAWRASRQGAGKMGWLSSWPTHHKQQIRFRACIAIGIGGEGAWVTKGNGDDKMN
jgi:hypothetical protein